MTSTDSPRKKNPLATALPGTVHHIRNRKGEKFTRSQRLTLYIPNKDRAGELVADHAKWTSEAQELLTEIGGGATAFPPVDGTWRKPDGSNLWEQTKIIY